MHNEPYGDEAFWRHIQTMHLLSIRCAINEFCFLLTAIAAAAAMTHWWSRALEVAAVAAFFFAGMAYWRSTAAQKSLEKSYDKWSAKRSDGDES